LEAFKAEPKTSLGVWGSGTSTGRRGERDGRVSRVFRDGFLGLQEL